MPMLILDAITQSPILDAITASFEPGRVVGIIGPNGAGKSTLLKTIASLQPPTSGRVHVDGMDLRRLPARHRARYIAYLPQTLSEEIPYTVREFVEMGRFSHQSMWSSSDKSGRLRVDDAIEEMGLARLCDMPLGHISGGERQRAGIARCLAQESPVLLLDEPISNLDVYYQLDIMTKLTELAAKGHLVLLAIHHLEFALRFCDEIVVIEDGSLYRHGPVADVFTEEMVRTVFHIDVSLFVDPVQGHPRLSMSPALSSAQRGGCINLDPCASIPE